MAKVNISVYVKDRDRLKELAWRERRPGFNPPDMAEQVARLIDFYEQAQAAPKNDE